MVCWAICVVCSIIFFWHAFLSRANLDLSLSRLGIIGILCFVLRVVVLQVVIVVVAADASVFDRLWFMTVQA